MSDNRSFDDKFWHDKHGKFVVWQKPNLFLITWAVSYFLTLFVPNGTADKVLHVVAVMAITIWALLELFRGANYFRRLLGLAVLLTIILFSLI